MEVGVTSTIQRRIKSSQSQLVMEMMIWYVEDVTMETQKMPVSTENTEAFVRICSVPPTPRLGKKRLSTSSHISLTGAGVTTVCEGSRCLMDTITEQSRKKARFLWWR